MSYLQQYLTMLLDKEPLKSTWYYQDVVLSAMEQTIYEAMLFDELFDANDVAKRLSKKGVLPQGEKIEQQLSYMALGSQEQRLIFREVLLALYDNYLQMLQTPQAAVNLLSDGLRAIAAETDEIGRIKRYTDEFVYIPKMLLLMMAEHENEGYDAQQQEKLAHIKPKFAKYYFNRVLEMLAADAEALPDEISTQETTAAIDDLLSIEAAAQGEMPEKRKIYGRIK